MSTRRRWMSLVLAVGALVSSLGCDDTHPIVTLAGSDCLPAQYWVESTDLCVDDVVSLVRTPAEYDAVFGPAPGCGDLGGVAPPPGAGQLLVVIPARGDFDDCAEVTCVRQESGELVVTITRPTGPLPGCGLFGIHAWALIDDPGGLPVRVEIVDD
ncbi:MAG: hypothetical protein AAF533_00585 [Acidobacteriota bacterium]